MRLTPDQETIVDRVVAKGKVRSAEDFVTVALRQMEGDLSADLESRVGMSIDQLNAELDKGLQGPVTEWEGAEVFHQRMLGRVDELTQVYVLGFRI